MVVKKKEEGERVVGDLKGGWRFEGVAGGGWRER